MSLPHQLTPVINSTNDIIAKADAPDYLTQLLALTPLPATKTVDKLLRYTVTVQADGSLAISTNFKP